MSPPLAQRVVYGYVSDADHQRLKRIAARQGLSVSALVRTALNDYLEDSGEQILMDLRPVGRPGHHDSHHL